VIIEALTTKDITKFEQQISVIHLYSWPMLLRCFSAPGKGGNTLTSSFIFQSKFFLVLANNRYHEEIRTGHYLLFVGHHFISANNSSKIAKSVSAV
jgi:hypothetical protein